MLADKWLQASVHVEVLLQVLLEIEASVANVAFVRLHWNVRAVVPLQRVLRRVDLCASVVAALELLRRHL